MKKYDRLVVPGIACILITMVLSGSYLLLQKQMVSVKKKQFEYMAANQASVISGKIDTAVARVYALEALIKSSGGELDFFDEQMQEIFEETVRMTGIKLKNVAAAPDGIVAKVYPLESNESLVGFNFMDETRPGNAEAIAAYQRGELVLTNPFELVQGGIGFAGRLPIFFQEGNQKTFWGLVTITIDFQEILESFALESFENAGIRYELWYTNGEEERVTLGASKEIPRYPVSHELTLSNLTWNLDVEPENGWYDKQEILMGLIMIGAVAFLITSLMLKKERIKEINEQLKQLAHRDQLTTCYSRHYVQTILLNQRNGQWNDPNMKYSIAMLDIDFFKEVNDTFGHETGDRVLIAIAQVIQSQIKEDRGDCVIRHGGDEFIILYNEVSKERFQKKLETILEEVRSIHFPDCPDMRLSVSIGGEYCANQEESLYYEMLRRADQKLYQAKENGKNQMVL